MKKIKVVMIALAVITLSFITEIYLYTEEKMNELGKNLGETNFWRNLEPNDENIANITYDDLNLGTLLSSNFKVVEELIIHDDNYNIKSNKWRDLIASNPILAYTAFDLYSSAFIEGYKSSFEEAKKRVLLNVTQNNSTDEENSRLLVSRINSLNSTNSLKSNVNSMKKYDKLIAEAPRGSVLKRAYRNKWENVKNAMTTAYPLLAEQLNPTTSNPRREEVIEDMRRLIGENRAPNKELANTFAAMISEYDKMISTKNILTESGSSLRVDALKRQLKEDTKDIMTELIKNNENAQTFYRSVIEPLIGD